MENSKRNKPSQQKSQGGLDNIFIAGITGFETLKKLAKEISSDSRNIIKPLEKGRVEVVKASLDLTGKYPNNNK